MNTTRWHSIVRAALVLVTVVAIGCGRNDCAERLARSGVLVGHSRQQVIDTLGQPDDQRHTLTYWIGTAPDYGDLMPRDDPSLTIQLVGGRVIRLSTSSFKGRPRPSSFDSEAWLTGDRRARGKMTLDLLGAGVLVGLDRDAVVEQLGEPDREDRYISYRRPPTRHASFSFDGDWVVTDSSVF